MAPILVVVLITAWRLLGVLCDHRQMEPLMEYSHRLTIGQGKPSLLFSTVWQVLGPFRSGTREATWGADPLEVYGGFCNLSYDPDAAFNSALAANGRVKWNIVNAHVQGDSNGHGSVGLNAWARGSLTVTGSDPQTVALFTDGLLELRVDGKRYFGGDYYRYRRAPIVLHLFSGQHVIDLRLIRDVRALGAIRQPNIEILIEAKLSREWLYIDINSLLISEVTQGKLGNSLASINVRNDMLEWVEVLWIRSVDTAHYEVAMKGGSSHLAPFQTRPIIFNVIIRELLALEFSAEIAYRVVNGDVRIFITQPFSIRLTEKSILEAQRLTFLHPAGIVSYTILRPPPNTTECISSDSHRAPPVILGLHGAGLEADSEQARRMLDSAYGICAWILFPSGVTSWSGDDWHTWGAADVQAAVAAVTLWIENIGWEGPPVALNDWIVTGHSNGGQGTWFLSTHYPDKVIAAAPVSGYSSIENYVPYNMWQDSEPLISSILQISRSSFKHELLLDNLAGIPMLLQHGAGDDNVPAYHSRLMHELMTRAALPSRYNELLGKGHWFEGIMTTSALVKFYNQSISLRPQLPLLPLTFSIVVPSSGDMGSKAGIFVDQLQSPDLYGYIKVTRDVKNGVWHLETANIRRFHLSSRMDRTEFPSMLVLDHAKKPFSVDAANCEGTWYLKDDLGGWKSSTNDGWRHLGQRYGRQLGTMDAILRSSGPFTINVFSSGCEHVALQISRNLLQYFAADSVIIENCNLSQSLHLPLHAENTESKSGNVITIALGDELPPSKYDTFPIYPDNGRLIFARSYIYNNVNPTADGGWPVNRPPYSKYYDFEHAMGAIFLRPLEDEKLELVVWGSDIEGLEQAARLVPTLTGVGQPDFLVLSESCRWKGHAGLYAAGFFDHSWRISPSSYVGGRVKQAEWDRAL